jgi:hypothetical protein
MRLAMSLRGSEHREPVMRRPSIESPFPASSLPPVRGEPWMYGWLHQRSCSAVFLLVEPRGLEPQRRDHGKSGTRPALTCCSSSSVRVV